MAANVQTHSHVYDCTNRPVYSTFEIYLVSTLLISCLCREGMVFFTCNKCGESLKKKDVEKHCNTRCGGPPFLTCVDCLKDFRDDYVKHTLCVTEDDRYSAMGLKGLQGKQKSKQQIWVETVQDCVSRAIDGGVQGITPSIQSLLLFLQDQPTLPDKQKAFYNFIKNARRTEPTQNIEFVWKVLEEARNDLQSKMKAEREAAEAAKKKAKQELMKAKGKETSDSSNSDDSDSSDSEKEVKPAKNQMQESSKQSKATQREGDSVNDMNGKKNKKDKKRMVSESESVVNGTTESRKAKKSKKNPEGETSELGNTSNLNNAMDACHLTSETNVDVDQKLSKEEKKEKKKRAKYEAELKGIETADGDEQSECKEEPVEDDVVQDTRQKEKRKKSKKNAVENCSNGVDEEQTEKPKKKEKKKKHKNQEENGNEHVAEDLDTKKVKSSRANSSGILNEDLVADEQQAKFSWDTAILQVLESQGEGGEISMKRLSKKVINEYLISLGDSGHVDEMKIMNKFHKRLEKMHNVLLYKDKVRLKTSRD